MTRILLVGLSVAVGLTTVSAVFAATPQAAAANPNADAPAAMPPAVAVHNAAPAARLDVRPGARYSAGRIVAFPYSPFRTYTLMARPNAITDIALGTGETLVTIALGDTVQWQVAHDPSNVFIKPIRPGIYTSATLITNRHRYQLLLISVRPGSEWYQQVSWATPAMLVMDTPGATPSGSSASPPDTQGPSKADATMSPVATAANPVPRAQLENLHFRYVVAGRARWRPLQVFDNGHATFIKEPAAIQEMPALFVIEGDDEIPAVVNYRVKGRWLIYPHLFDAAVLRLGDETVQINRR
jgi:type IV secretion system protein VirB9